MRAQNSISFVSKFKHKGDELSLKIILLGAPGAGKGTQSEFICNHYKIPAISTGNIFRDVLKSGSELGMQVKSLISSGHLVPDDIVIELVRERLTHDDCANGFILDGFPRTIPQAEALEDIGVIIDSVVDIKLSDNLIIERLSGRRICEKCGASYNLVFKKPREKGVCDTCSGTLVQRKDDAEETVKQRLKVYHDQTEPLKAYYKKQNKLMIVDGSLTISEISEKIIAGLEASAV